PDPDPTSDLEHERRVSDAAEDLGRVADCPRAYAEEYLVPAGRRDRDALTPQVAAHADQLELDGGPSRNVEAALDPCARRGAPLGAPGGRVHGDDLGLDVGGAIVVRHR